MTCDDTNLASITVIERCGGELQDTFVDEARPVPKRRYWVPTNGRRDINSSER